MCELAVPYVEALALKAYVIVPPGAVTPFFNSEFSNCITLGLIIFLVDLVMNSL